MKQIISLITIFLCISFAARADEEQRWSGGDISLLPEYEKAGAQYKDTAGRPISELLPWLHNQGMNAMRVRLFVNPDRYKAEHANDTGDTRYDPNACQDLEYIRALCKRIVDNGFALMLDFHYSDTWADPAKQWTPADWVGLSDQALADTLYSYTKRVLLQFKADGVVPAFIQPGNEISYGMLWGPVGSSDPKKVYTSSNANWNRFGLLLRSAIKACREVCPEAKIVIHSERVSQPTILSDFYRKLNELNVDYDIVGLSYYPYFHGPMSVLDTSLKTIQTNYPSKKIMIVETGYSYKWAVPGSNHDLTGTWPYSDEGQAKFASDLVTTLLKYPSVNGLFWWWMEYNAFNTNLSGWYNAPLFDSTTGKATKALKIIAGFSLGTGAVDGIFDDSFINDSWYDLQGRKLPSKPAKSGLYIHRGKVTLITPEM